MSAGELSEMRQGAWIGNIEGLAQSLAEPLELNRRAEQSRETKCSAWTNSNRLAPVFQRRLRGAKQLGPGGHGRHIVAALGNPKNSLRHT